MDKLILEEKFLMECKNKIMHGKSISSLAQEFHIDRRTLKKKILEILSEKEKQEFEEKLNTNFRKNRKSTRTIKKEQREENYKKAVEKLISLGITKEDMESIIKVLNINSHTTMAKDTFAIKLVELFEFIKDRNLDIDLNEEGYISKQDVISMIIRDSRFMSNDIERKIKPMCEILDTWSPNISKEQVNRYIVEYPMIFKNSIKKLKMHLIIGDNFMVRMGNRYVTLSEYILTENPFLIFENTQRFLEGMCNLRDSSISGIIHFEELEKRLKPTNPSNEKYKLPEYTDDNNFKKEVKRIIDERNIEDKRKKGEEI